MSSQYNILTGASCDSMEAPEQIVFPSHWQIPKSASGGIDARRLKKQMSYIEVGFWELKQ